MGRGDLPSDVTCDVSFILHCSVYRSFSVPNYDCPCFWYMHVMCLPLELFLDICLHLIVALLGSCVQASTLAPSNFAIFKSVCMVYGFPNCDIHTYIHTCIHTYIHTYKHTYIHSW